MRKFLKVKLRRGCASCDVCQLAVRTKECQGPSRRRARLKERHLLRRKSMLPRAALHWVSIREFL